MLSKKVHQSREISKIGGLFKKKFFKLYDDNIIDELFLGYDIKNYREWS